MESVRSMLADSGLPHKFWAEVLSTPVYLINRSPTKSLDNKTPFEAWYRKLVTYGCLGVQPTSTSQEMRGRNWTPKQRNAYGTARKGYRLYDQKTSRIVHSRDVVFNESSRGREGEEEKCLIEVKNFTPESEEEPD